MRIRTGHGPNDWADQGPSAAWLARGARGDSIGGGQIVSSQKAPSTRVPSNSEQRRQRERWAKAKAETSPDGLA